MKKIVLLIIVGVLCGTSLEDEPECGCTDAELNYQGETLEQGLSDEEGA